MPDFILYGIVGLMAYQAYVTVRVVQRKSTTPAQEGRQLLFVWLVPFFGAAITLATLTTDKDS